MGGVRDESKCEYRCLVCLPPQSREVAEGCSIAELSDHHPWGGGGAEGDREMKHSLNH